MNDAQEIMAGLYQHFSFRQRFTAELHAVTQASMTKKRTKKYERI